MICQELVCRQSLRLFLEKACEYGGQRWCYEAELCPSVEVSRMGYCQLRKPKVSMISR